MLSDLSGMEMFFMFCAIVGGGVFILRSVMIFAGLGGDDMALDADAVDVDIGDDSAADFKMVSVHGLTAFFLMFGLVGFMILRGEGGALAAVALGALAGLLTMLIIAKLFSSSRKLQSDGTIYPEETVGASGTVYLEIRPGQIGKVQINVKGASKIFDARANNATAKISTGDPVKVVEAGDPLIVEKTN